MDVVLTLNHIGVVFKIANDGSAVVPLAAVSVLAYTQGSQVMKFARNETRSGGWGVRLESPAMLLPIPCGPASGA